MEDSREGWCDAFYQVFYAAFHGPSITMDVSRIRPKGSPIRTFGGTSSGPDALVTLLVFTYTLVKKGMLDRGYLRTIDLLDIINNIGVAVVSGGARRSAIMALGRANDEKLMSRL